MSKVPGLDKITLCDGNAFVIVPMMDGSMVMCAISGIVVRWSMIANEPPWLYCNGNSTGSISEEVGSELKGLMMVYES